MDGTLIDSGEYHWFAWRDTMDAEGQPITYEQFAATFGQRNDTILRGYFGATLAHREMQRIADEKEERYREHIRTLGITLLPGIAFWLDHLQREGWRQAVASAAPRRNIEVILDVLAIWPYFDAIVASEDVQRGKPDPQVFLTAAARLEVAPSQSIVVEDAPAGLEGARRAGMRTIGVCTSHSDLHADRVVATLDALDANAFVQLLAAPSPAME